MLSFSTGSIVTGIIVGIVMGILHGIYITYFSVAKSNVVGDEEYNFSEQNENVVFHKRERLK